MFLRLSVTPKTQGKGIVVERAMCWSIHGEGTGTENTPRDNGFRRSEGLDGATPSVKCRHVVAKTR